MEEVNKWKAMVVPYEKAEKYFRKLLYANGKYLCKFETTHIMILYFAIHGLDVLGVNLSEEQSSRIKSYILSLQIKSGGFSPSSFYSNLGSTQNMFNQPHIVYTYSALNILHVLGGLHLIQKQKCVQSVLKCFKLNGSFSNFQASSEADLRFVYAAISICKMLDCLSILDEKLIMQYIESCRNFDGGYGLRPNCESHSGAIYCALAALKMLEGKVKNPSMTLNFLVNRQIHNKTSSSIIGVQGRVGKYPDSCYTFWVGASIKMLTEQNLIDSNVQSFLSLCFNESEGNFSKYPNMAGDPLHTLHSIVGLKILHDEVESGDLIRGVQAKKEKEEGVQAKRQQK